MELSSNELAPMQGDCREETRRAYKIYFCIILFDQLDFLID